MPAVPLRTGVDHEQIARDIPVEIAKRASERRLRREKAPHVVGSFQVDTIDQTPGYRALLRRGCQRVISVDSDVLRSVREADVIGVNGDHVVTIESADVLDREGRGRPSDVNAIRDKFAGRVIDADVFDLELRDVGEPHPEAGRAVALVIGDLDPGYSGELDRSNDDAIRVHGIRIELPRSAVPGIVVAVDRATIHPDLKVLNSRRAQLMRVHHHRLLVCVSASLPGEARPGVAANLGVGVDDQPAARRVDHNEALIDHKFQRAGCRRLIHDDLHRGAVVGSCVGGR